MKMLIDLNEEEIKHAAKTMLDEEEAPLSIIFSEDDLWLFFCPVKQFWGYERRFRLREALENELNEHGKTAETWEAELLRGLIAVIDEFKNQQETTT